MKTIKYHMNEHLYMHIWCPHKGKIYKMHSAKYACTVDGMYIMLVC